MNVEHTNRQEHLSLNSKLELVDFCKLFSLALRLPEMKLDCENENEWAEVEFENINYNVSHPYENGVLQGWDWSTPIDSNFGVCLSILKSHPRSEDSKWIYQNLVVFVANILADIFKTPIHYHRTWHGPGKNEIKYITFKAV